MMAFKRIFKILPAVVLVFILTGCPGKGTGITEEGPGPSGTPPGELFPSDEVSPDDVTTSDEVTTVEEGTPEAERETELGTSPVAWINAQMYGSPGEDVANSAAVDSSGNLYVTGSTAGSVLLVKYSPQGEKLWSHTLSSGVGKSVAVTNDGSVYVVGDTSVALSGCNPACEYKGRSDMFLAKFIASSGAVQFIRQYGSPGMDTATDLATHAAAIYIVGSTDRGDEFCVTSDRCGVSYGFMDAFLINVNNLGIGPFIRTFGTAKSESAKAIAVDNAGSIYIAGNTGGCMDPSFTRCNEGTKTDIDAFVSKFRSPGDMTPIIRQFGFPSSGINENVGGMGLDMNRNILVGGAVAYEPFIYKFNPDFARLWRRFLLLESKELVEGMVVDNEGSSYLVGGTNCVEMFPGYNCDVLIVKYDKNGNGKWVGSFATQEDKDDLARGAALSPDGRYLYVVGYTYGSFDGIENKGKSDIFILKLDAASGVKY